MNIVKITDLVYAEPRPTTVEERQAKHDSILKGLDVPIHLGRCISVTYDNKSDRYTVTCIPASEKKLVLKATDEVAAFIAVAGLDASGYWLGRMEKGALVDVFLIKA